MTRDHIDQFSDALDAERRGYLIIVHDGLHKSNSGAHVRSDFENWPEPEKGCGSGKSKAHDCLLAIAAALSEDGERFEIVRHEQ